MSLDNKVIWSEGMFLSPQHFQQQERYLERYINNKCLAYGAYGWGFQELEIDDQLLKLGKVSIIRGSGVFPDGTPFSFPDVDEAPPVFEVPGNTHNSIVYLAVPLKRSGAVEVLPKDSTQGLARYYSSEQQVRDITDESSEDLTLGIGKLRYRLLLESDDLSGYAVIGLLRIAESREDKTVLLDDQYIPTYLNCNLSLKLKSFLSELVGLLRQRGDAIAGRLADVRKGGTAEVKDYMLLQLINRLDPIAVHLSTVNGLHPVNLFSELVQMAGELSTFSSKNKRAPQLPAYLHEDLPNTFLPIMAVLRQYLTMVDIQTAIPLRLLDKGNGFRAAVISDRSLLETAMFVLAARADVTDQTIRKLFPAQIRIGPVERIQQLVTAAMPGIAISPLPVAPREIPFRSGYTYFALDKNSGLWKELQRSGGFALHLMTGDFPGLEMEFWAIRQ